MSVTFLGGVSITPRDSVLCGSKSYRLVVGRSFEGAIPIEVRNDGLSREGRRIAWLHERGARKVCAVSVVSMLTVLTSVTTEVSEKSILTAGL